MFSKNCKDFFPIGIIICFYAIFRDLSKNQLTELYVHQFYEVSNLKRLDLSLNLIKHIDLEAFSNLNHLERLKLNHNQISVITQGTFIPLMNIKQL